MSILSFVFSFGVQGVVAAAIVIYLLLGLKIVNEYERGVKFTMGKYSGMMNPGLKIVLPIIQSWQRIDIRTKTIDVPDQETITKDNVSVKINAVLYYKVTDATKSVLEVSDFMFATSQIAQTSLRDVVGMVSLDHLLTSRETISKKIREAVDTATDPWGIKVDAVDVKDVVLPDQMKRTMAKDHN